MHKILTIFCLLFILCVGPALADGRSGVEQWINPAESTWLRSWICSIRQVTYVSIDEVPPCIKRFYVPFGDLRRIHNTFASGAEPYRRGCLRGETADQLPERKLAFCARSGDLYVVAYTTYTLLVVRSIDAFVVKEDEIAHKSSGLQLYVEDISSFDRVVSALRSQRSYE